MTFGKWFSSRELSWFLVGDSAKVLPGLKELGMKIVELDANGNIKSTTGR